MFAAARLTQVPLTAFVTTLSKPSLLSQPLTVPNIVARTRQYASQAKVSRPFRRTRQQTTSQTQTLKEKIMAPAGDTAFTMGRGLVAGASLLGIGSLAFYGLGLSNQVGAIDRAVLWPQIVRDRIKTTYMYFGGGIAITAASALAASRSPVILNLMMKNSIMAMIGTFAVIIGSGMVVRSIPYKEGFGAKQLAWMGHAGIMGAVIAPLCLLGGPILVRAAWMTAGIVGGLSTIAACAPSEKFLNMGGPLACGLGLVFASSIGSMFLPPTSALGAGLYSVAMYGGLVLFSLFLLYDTQKIIKRAETHPVYSTVPFDPINSSISIYLDTLNIFIRLAMIMAGGGGRRK
ncbi:unnamed protein product [Owenia fusiformis]|uniref:Uncharacterized protein n=1 Tax=Owenia fusiformis TaxID=6347 RepID=A0A8J1U3U9_OWEFU|nr:unnamed protein product [Owenia fusiformis]